MIKAICPHCGNQNNHRESSVDTPVKCKWCSQQYVLKKPKLGCGLITTVATLGLLCVGSCMFCVVPAQFVGDSRPSAASGGNASDSASSTLVEEHSTRNDNSATTTDLQPSKKSKDVSRIATLPYKVITSETQNGTRIVIRLPSRYSHSEVFNISKKVFAESNPVEVTDVTFFLPNMLETGSPWAVAKPEHNIGVEILGLTDLEVTELLSTDPQKDNHVGRWLDDEKRRRITIVRINGHLWFEELKPGVAEKLLARLPFVVQSGSGWKASPMTTEERSFQITDSGELMISENQILVPEYFSIAKLREQLRYRKDRWNRDSRTWKSKSGTYELEARFDHATEQLVYLELEDGTFREVEIAKLSTEDKEAIAELREVR